MRRERWARWLLDASMRLYPRELRDEVGDELREGLVRRLEKVGGRGPVRAARVFRVVLGDAIQARRLRGRRPYARSTLDSLRVDGRYALRRLAKTPLFTAVAALSLGLGIGANSAAFSVVSSVLFRTFPAEDPATLVDVFMRDNGGFLYAPMSWIDMKELEAQNDVFDAVIGARTFIAQAGPPDAPGLVLGELVSGNYFPTLGTRAAVGRLFTADDDLRPGAHPVAVLGHAFWVDHFGGSRGVVGSTIRINQQPYTVVGVTPERFNGSFPGIEAQVWVPLTMMETAMGAGAAGQLEKRTSRSIFVKARLSPAVTPAQAHASVEVLSRRWSDELPDTNRGRTMTAIPTGDVAINPAVDPFLTPAAALLLAVVGLVLLVACTNLAGFLLARAEERRGEIAVRLALGATRANLVRQLLVESLALGLLGGVVGWLFARWTVDLMTRFQPPTPVPLSLDLGLDGTTLAWTALVSLAAAVLFGLAPALQASRPELVSALRGSSGGARGRRLSLRDGMVVAQVSLSMVLLVGAGLFLKSVRDARGTDPGFYTGTGALLWPNFELSGYTADEALPLRERLLERLGEIPGVEGVAMTDRMPLGFAVQTTEVDVPDRPASADRSAWDIDFALVSTSYFDVMEVPIVDGRGFSADPSGDGRPVAVVSRAFAQRFWPDESALGRRLEASGETWEIVGVAGDTKVRTLGESARPYLYLPAERDDVHPLGLQLVVRGSRDSAAILAAARRAFEDVAPGVVLMEAKTMEEHLALLLYPARAAATLLTAFGGLALLLATIGLYGIVSFAVSRRTREVGIRVSLGATRRGVVGLLVTSGMKLVAVGTLLGLAAAAGAAALVSRFLFASEGLPVGTFLGVAGLLGAVALAAAWLSARRAGTIDPVEALRSE